MEVKLRRIELGLTQLELAKKVHMSLNRCVKVEKGDYDILKLSEMKRIATVLNTTVLELFF